MRLADLLHRELRDPRLAGVHLTRVEMVGDLSRARIYFRTMPGMASVEDALEGARAATGFLRRELGKSLRLRGTPELDFRFDDVPDEGDRIEQLLRASRTAPQDGDGPDTPRAAGDADGRDDRVARGGEEE